MSLGYKIASATRRFVRSLPRRAEFVADRASRWVAFHIPARVASHATVRVGAYATSGRYGHDHPHDVDFMEAVRRFDRGHGIGGGARR